MRRKTRLILLTLIGTMIILLIALGFSYAYMKGLISDGAKSTVSVNNCAKILLTESGSSINLSNTYPMSDNAGLNTTPYTFGIRSTCSGNRGFKLYIVTISGNTLSANNVKYALTLKGTKDILTSGKVGQLSSGSSDYNATALSQLGANVGTVDSIYFAYEDNIDLGEVTYYDLYMWADKDAINSVANQTFTAAISVLEGPYDYTDIKVVLGENITSFDANVSCSGTNDAQWNPLNRRVEIFDITTRPTICTVSNKTNTNIGNLKSIVESAGYEELGTGDFTNNAQNKYTMQTPFYTSSFSTSVTSGTNESGSISWDTTNSYWITNPSIAWKYYYYLFTVTDAGYYQFCVKYLSGSTNNHLYIYKNTNNIYEGADDFLIVGSSTDNCYGYNYVTPSDIIRITQYVYSTTASLAIYMQKANTIENAGYRYEGQDPNNYVWFNNEMWRIIGSVPAKIDSGDSTTTTNLVKIMRMYSIGGLDMDIAGENVWNNTSLYTILNSYYYGALNATGSEYCNTKMKCDYRYIGIEPNSYYETMIKEVYWNTGPSNYSFAVSSIYFDEIKEQTIKGKVGLMNISDYGYATDYDRDCRSIMSQYGGLYSTNNWIYSQSTEYTITPNSGDSKVITRDASAKNSNTTIVYVIRPVVYLEPSVYVISGNGSQGEPYKLGI